MKCREASHNMPVTVEDFAQKWAADLGKAESVRTGHPLPIACKAVARRLGLPVSSIDNIRRGRVKTVSARALEKIRSAVISKIQFEMQALQDELDLASGTVPNTEDAAILEAQAALDAARKILGGK